MKRNGKASYNRAGRSAEPLCRSSHLHPTHVFSLSQPEDARVRSEIQHGRRSRCWYSLRGQHHGFALSRRAAHQAIRVPHLCAGAVEDSLRSSISCFNGCVELWCPGAYSRTRRIMSLGASVFDTKPSARPPPHVHGAGTERGQNQPCRAWGSDRSLRQLLQCRPHQAWQYPSTPHPAVRRWESRNLQRYGVSGACRRAFVSPLDPISNPLRSPVRLPAVAFTASTSSARSVVFVAVVFGALDWYRLHTNHQQLGIRCARLRCTKSRYRSWNVQHCSTSMERETTLRSDYDIRSAAPDNGRYSRNTILRYNANFQYAAQRHRCRRSDINGDDLQL